MSWSRFNSNVFPFQAWTEFPDNRHMKVVRLSALRSGHIYSQEIALVLISITGLVDPTAKVQPEELRQ
jgi:hypothetical protein